MACAAIRGELALKHCDFIAQDERTFVQNFLYHLLDFSFDVASESSDDTSDEEIRELCSDNIKPTLDNIDHFDWIHCSGDIQAIWTALNIKEETFQQTSSLSEASSVWGDVDGDAKPERILRLTLRTPQEAIVRFVILKYTPGRVRTRWRRLAHLDIPRFHLAPEARAVSSARASWLAIANVERLWEQGTVQENEQWYELKDGRLNEVLSFPLEGEAVSSEKSQIQRRIQSEVMGVLWDWKRDKVTIRLTAWFRWASPEKTMEVRRKVTFSKSGSSDQFVFDPLESDVSETTYRTIYDIASGGFTDDAVTKLAREIGLPTPR